MGVVGSLLADLRRPGSLDGVARRDLLVTTLVELDSDRFTLNERHRRKQPDWTEHTAAVPAVVQVLRGRLELSLGDEETTAGPGSWIHLPAQLQHSVRAEEPSVMLLTMLRDG